MRNIVLVILILHSGLSIQAVAKHGYLSVFPPFSELWALQMFSDLAISLGVVLLLLYREAKIKKRPLLRWSACVIGALLFGSISPLVYLLVEKELLA